MKLKTIASAVAVAAATSFTPAFAGISTINDAELFIVVFDDAASYSFDTGIHIDTFLGTSGLANTTASNFSFNVGALYAGFSAPGTPGAGGTVPKRWALFAVDNETDSLPGGYRLLTTGANGVQPDFLDAGNLQTDVGQMESAVVSMNQTSPAGAAFAGNGESFNVRGTAAYYDDSILTAANTRTANLVGVSSPLWLAYNATYDSSDPTAMTKLAGTASFNGTTFGYAIPVAAVPEPETLALLLAGLGVVGFVARSRKA